MCELSLQEEMAYGGELFRAVQADFIACIPAVELMDVECISDKLTDEEMVWLELLLLVSHVLMFSQCQVRW